MCEGCFPEVANVSLASCHKTAPGEVEELKKDKVKTRSMFPELNNLEDFCPDSFSPAAERPDSPPVPGGAQPAGDVWATFPVSSKYTLSSGGSPSRCDTVLQQRASNIYLYPEVGKVYIKNGNK